MGIPPTEIPSNNPMQREYTMSMKGKIVCFTGKLSKTRKEMEAEAKKKGLKTRSMSSKVDYLIAGDQVATEHTKYQEAIELVQVLSETEYRFNLSITGVYHDL